MPVHRLSLFTRGLRAPFFCLKPVLLPLGITRARLSFGATHVSLWRPPRVSRREMVEAGLHVGMGLALALLGRQGGRSCAAFSAAAMGVQGKRPFLHVLDAIGTVREAISLHYCGVNDGNTNTTRPRLLGRSSKAMA